MCEKNMNVDVKESTSKEENTSPVMAPEYYMKHPLEHTWCLWHMNNEVEKNIQSFGNNLIKLHTFNTVEDFWCLYHHIKLPSELKRGQDYAIFKEGIRPLWEDILNLGGGQWVIRCSRSFVDTFWLDTVLLMIGENFENNLAICGAVVKVRQINKINVWTKNVSKEVNKTIGRKLKIELAYDLPLGFTFHNSSKFEYYSCV